MGIIDWLNTNSGAIIGIAIVLLVGVISYYVYLTWRLLKANNTPEIAISLRPHEAHIAGDNPRLPHEEFKAALEEWDALVKKLTKTEAEPLSDYAMSRESIYEGHPKL